MSAKHTGRALGGLARMRGLTPDQRKELAFKAAMIRWNSYKDEKNKVESVNIQKPSKPLGDHLL